MLRGLLLFSPIMALFCLITAVYVASYYEKSQQNESTDPGTVVQAGRKEDPTEEEQHLIEHETVERPMDHSSNVLPEETQSYLSVDDSTDIYITPRMTYTLEIYDARSRKLSNEIQPIPHEMYGLNREELERYLLELAAKENDEDNEMVYHYQVTVFSRRAFTVRLTITEKKPEYAIFLIAEEGWLTAYTGDRKAVYEKLNIMLEEFPLEQQTMLTQGIYMKTLADYYDFLETYSS